MRQTSLDVRNICFLDALLLAESHLLLAAHLGVQVLFSRHFCEDFTAGCHLVAFGGGLRFGWIVRGV